MILHQLPAWHLQQTETFSRTGRPPPDQLSCFIDPFSVKPINYDISLYDLEYEGEFTYKGSVKIELEVKGPTKDIVVNAHQLKIQDAGVSIKGAEGEIYEPNPLRMAVLTRPSAEGS